MEDRAIATESWKQDEDNSNGNLILAPNGTGDVAITADTLSVTATEGESATLLLSADESDDNGDDWSLVNSTGNTLTFNNIIVN